MLELLLRQEGDAEPGFSRKAVKWGIVCSGEGLFEGLFSLAEDKGRMFEGCPDLMQAELIGGNEPRSHFLVDSLATMACFVKGDADSKTQEKLRAKQGFFRHMLQEVSVQAPYLASAAKMLGDPGQLELLKTELQRQRAAPTDSAVVIVDGINPLEQDDWREWWREFRRGLGREKAKNFGRRMVDIATGDWATPAATHPKIKGLAGVGGLPTGDVLVGFDKEAFRSYGFEQSANAAMSEETAKKYTEALNRLIKEKARRLGDALCVYWFSKETGEDEDPLYWLHEPGEQTSSAAEGEARRLLDALRTGGRPDLSGNIYYALFVSGAAGRVMVREYMQGAFEDLVAAINQWFSHLECCARDGKGIAKAPKFMAVAGSLVRDLGDMPQPWLQRLWRAAATGSALPEFVIPQAVLRFRADVIKNNPANHARMGLIKAYHIRKGDEHMSAYLNPDHPHPAYHCGRLLALFAGLQRAALGEVGAGVVQRYYAAASQTPGLVIGRLTANAKNHLSKLDTGLAQWFEKEIAQVMGAIENHIPRTLTLEEQSLFALGYYQQLAARGRKSNSERDENHTIQREEQA